MTRTETAVAELVASIRAEVEQEARPQPLLLSIPEAAVRLGIGRTSLYGLLDSGAIPSRKLNRRRLIAASDVESYANQS